MEEGEGLSQSTTTSALLRPAPVVPVRQSRLFALLTRASGRRGPSMLVRETAALQLEERRANWAYSRPVVALDIAWNMAFATVAVAVLATTTRERPSTPLRVWVAGYAVQCVVHILLVCMEYRRRQRRRRGSRGRDVEEDGRAPTDTETPEGEEEADESTSGRRSFAKRLETINTMVSFLWWIIGFYWIICGGVNLLHDAPRLYWVTVIFLAFDVFFTVFCVAIACVIGLALCCCLPCIITVLYAMAGQEGASDADISFLPRYRYSASYEDAEKTTEDGVMIPINTGGTMTSERVLQHENALQLHDKGFAPAVDDFRKLIKPLKTALECCICLTAYEDGVELHALPCNHHFHSSCIVKWLRLHATCPLCKYNILKDSDVV